MSRTTNQMNALKNGSFASATKEQRMEFFSQQRANDIFGQLSLNDGFIDLINDNIKKGYKFPEQNEIPELTEDMIKEDLQIIAYSQQHQNRSDRFQRDAGMDYCEDMYIIKQNGEEYRMIGTFSPYDMYEDSMNEKKEKPINYIEGSIADYKEKYPDTIILGVGQFYETDLFE